MSKNKSKWYPVKSFQNPQQPKNGIEDDILKQIITDTTNLRLTEDDLYLTVKPLINHSQATILR